MKFVIKPREVWFIVKNYVENVEYNFFVQAFVSKKNKISNTNARAPIFQGNFLAKEVSYEKGDLYNFDVFFNEESFSILLCRKLHSSKRIINKNFGCGIRREWLCFSTLPTNVRFWHE